MRSLERGTHHTAVVASLRQALAERVPIWMRVTSDSMSPLFGAGDQVRVVDVGRDILQVGNVLVLDEGHGFLMHRLRQIRGELLYTRGDRSLVYDAPFAMEQVMGLVTAVRRNGLEQEVDPALNEALHQLARAEEQRLACLRQIGQAQFPTLSDRIWHRLYFYRRWWLIRKNQTELNL